jgi:hypothetical protein
MANNAIQIFDGTATEVISEATSDPADGTVFGGTSVWDNTSDLWPMAIATLFVTDSATTLAVGSCDLYCMKGNVGSGAEDEDAGGITYGLSLAASTAETQTQGLHYMGSFSFDSDLGAQRRTITISTLGIKEAYFYLVNNCVNAMGQPITLDIEGFTLTPSA